MTWSRMDLDFERPASVRQIYHEGEVLWGKASTCRRPRVERPFAGSPDCRRSGPGAQGDCGYTC